jgi:hypothetical protein
MANIYKNFINTFYLTTQPKTQKGQLKDHAPYDKYSRFGMKDPKFDLKAYQNIAVNRITNYCDNKGVLLMHGVGSGKTLTSLTIALNSLELIDKNDKEQNIIVIIHPTGLYSQFHNEIVTKLPGISEYTTQEKKNASDNEKTLQSRFKLNVKDESVNFYNFNFVHNKDKKIKTRRIIIISKIYKHFKLLLPTTDSCIELQKALEGTVIIFDEAHRLLRPIVPGTMAPTMIARLLDEKVATKCKKLIVMSGTPILESISDIFLLLRFVTEFSGTELSKDNINFTNEHGEELKYNFDLNNIEIYKYFTHSDKYSNFLEKMGWNEKFDQWNLYYGFFNSDNWKYMKTVAIDKILDQKLKNQKVNPIYEWFYSDALADTALPKNTNSSPDKINWYNTIIDYLYDTKYTIDKIHTMTYIGKMVVEHLYPIDNQNYNNFPREIIWNLKNIYRNPTEWFSNYSRVNSWFNKNKDIIGKYNKKDDILTEYHLQNIYKSMLGGKRNGKYTGGEKYTTNKSISTPIKRINDIIKKKSDKPVTYLWKQTRPKTDFYALYNESKDYITKNIIKGYIEELELDEEISISKLLKAARNYISIIDVDQPDIVNNFMNSYTYDEEAINKLKEMKNKYETIINNQSPQPIDMNERLTKKEETKGGRAPTSEIDPGLSSTTYEIIKEVYDQNNLINESPKEVCNYPNKIINSVFIPYNNEQIYFKSVIEYSLQDKFKKANNIKQATNCINHFPFCQWYLTDEEWGSWMNKCCSSYSSSVDYCSVKYNEIFHIYETIPFYDTNNEIDLTFSCPKFEKVFALLLLHKFGLSYNFETSETVVLPHLKSDEEEYNSNMLKEGRHIIPIDRADKYYLPIVYSSSDLIGLNLFAAFLENKLKLKPENKESPEWKNKPYLVLHDMDSKSHQGEIQKNSFGRTYKIMKLAIVSNHIKTIIRCLQLNKPIPHEIVNIFNTEFNLYKEPLCMLLHPLMTEGFDAKFNPSVILLDTAKTYSDFEQICGRVLRTYSPAYKECPNKMIYQFLGYNISNLKELLDEYSGVPLETTSIEGSLTIGKKSSRINYINNIVNVEFDVRDSWITRLYKLIDKNHTTDTHEGTYDISYKLRHDIHSVKLFFDDLVMNSHDYKTLIEKREDVQDRLLFTYMDETVLFNMKTKDPNNPYAGKNVAWYKSILPSFLQSFNTKSYIKEWSFYVPKYNLITCFDKENIINALSQKDIKIKGTIIEHKNEEYTVQYDNNKTGTFKDNNLIVLEDKNVLITISHLLPNVYKELYYSLIAAYTSVKGLQNNINIWRNNGIFWRSNDNIVDNDYLNLDTQSEYTWIELLLNKIKKLENDLTDKWKNTEKKLVDNYYLWFKNRKEYVNYKDNLIEDKYDIDSMFLSLNAIEDLKLVNLLKMKLIDIYTNYYDDENVPGKDNNYYDVNIKILINSIPTLEEISYIKENKMNDELEQIIKIYHDEYTFKKFKDGLKRLDENDKLLNKQVIPDLLSIDKCVRKNPELKNKRWCDPLSINSSNMCSHEDNNLYSSEFTEENKTKINNLLNLRKIKDMSENLDMYYQNKQDKTRIGELKRILDFLTENKKIEISNLFTNKDITVEQFNRNINEFVIDEDILNSIPTILKDIKQIESDLNKSKIEQQLKQEAEKQENINKFFEDKKNKDIQPAIKEIDIDTNTIKYEDGSIYIGNHKSGIRNGKGVLTYRNEDIYEGEWKEDKREGHGKISFYDENPNNTQTNMGNQILRKMGWLNDRKSLGKAENGISETCEGEWKEDKRQGKHRYTKKSGEVFYLHFDNGRITGSYDNETSTTIKNTFGQIGVSAWSLKQRFKGGKTSTRKQKGGKKSKKYGKNKKHGRTKYKRTNRKTRKLQK